LQNSNKIIGKKIIVGTKIMKEVAKRIINITGIKIEIDKEKHSEIKININDKNQDKNKE
jgi:hypothetical protein